MARTATAVVIGKDEYGNPIRQRLVDSGVTDSDGHPMFNLAVDTTIDASGIVITSLELKDGTTAAVAKVRATDSISEGDLALATHDPITGVSSGAAVITDAAGTLQQYLRGLVKLLAGTITATLAAGTAAIGGVTSLGYDASVVNSIGVSGAAFQSNDASGAAAAVTDAPTAGKKLVVTDVIVGNDAVTAITLTFTEQTSGTILLVVPLATKTSLQVALRGKLKLATADKKLMVKASVAGAIAVTPIYYSE